MIKYPSIDQYRNAIASVQRLTLNAYGKRDASGELIESQPRTWKFPSVEFIGTVKLHGTNAAVVVKDGQVSYQSRNRELTPGDDNMGFAAWASQHEAEWLHVAERLAVCGRLSPFHDFPNGVVMFGEWIGQGIQDGVALSELSRRFVIFEAMDVDGVPINLGHNLTDELPDDTYTITDFPTWKMTVDMEQPQLVQNQLVDITLGVEAECPVGKAFGVSGIGEGVVWSANVFGQIIRFKVKGDKHSTYKVKKLASIDPDAVDSVGEFVTAALTDRRLDQGLEYLQEHGIELSVKSTGDYIRWIIGDVFKEEADTIAANELNDAEVRRRIGQTAALRYKARVFTMPDTASA